MENAFPASWSLYRRGTGGSCAAADGLPAGAATSTGVRGPGLCGFAARPSDLGSSLFVLLRSCFCVLGGGCGRHVPRSAQRECTSSLRLQMRSLGVGKSFGVGHWSGFDASFLGLNRCWPALRPTARRVMTRSHSRCRLRCCCPVIPFGQRSLIVWSGLRCLFSGMVRRVCCPGSHPSRPSLWSAHDVPPAMACAWLNASVDSWLMLVGRWSAVWQRGLMPLRIGAACAVVVVLSLFSGRLCIVSTHPSIERFNGL